MLRLASRRFCQYRPISSRFSSAFSQLLAAQDKCGKEEHSLFFSNHFGALGRRDVREWGTASDVSILKQHTRSFLGCIQAPEDSESSRHFEEVRLIGYSPDQLFAVVAAVDLYEDFVPWCQRSTILRRNDDESFDADLEIGFKFFVERYVSHVHVKRPNLVQTSVSQSNLFDYLRNTWEFQPGPVLGSCNLHMMVDFQFSSPLYRKVSNMFLDEVVARLVTSFEDRCRRVYGPSTKISKSSYQALVPNSASA